MAELNPRQLRFVQLYVRLGNATKAAEEAGYSAKTARSQGNRLLTNVDIAAAIAAAQEDIQVILAGEILASVRTVVAIRDDVENPAQVRLMASKDLLDRAGLKPTEKVEHAGKVGVQHGVEPNEFNAVLIALGYAPSGTVETSGPEETGTGDPTPTPD